MAWTANVDAGACIHLDTARPEIENPIAAVGLILLRRHIVVAAEVLVQFG